MIEERKKIILRELNKHGNITVVDLVELIGASESTIRRDLLEMDEEGLLKRIHGGATLIQKETRTTEDPLNERQQQHLEEKNQIGRYAADLVEEHDVVFLDSGSTTLCMIEYLTQKNALYVTNGLMQAHQLASKGFHVVCIGGEIRGITGACVGTKSALALARYHFTKGFFGTNGVDVVYGYTTPDHEEAAMKETALQQCMMSYVLCDHTKFHQCTPITFGDIHDSIIITDQCLEAEIKQHTSVVEVMI